MQNFPLFSHNVVQASKFRHIKIKSRSPDAIVGTPFWAPMGGLEVEIQPFASKGALQGLLKFRIPQSAIPNNNNTRHTRVNS